MSREPALKLTSDDTRGTRSVHVGDQIQVRLEENPTTGYRWEPDIDPLVLREVDDRYTGGVDRRGEPGVRVKTFEAMTPAWTQLRLVERRSWETTPSDEFVVQLDIAP
ncbi:MAG TPA: protease inhibitor I42 family protein [Acidimicrobiales bacterium]